MSLPAASWEPRLSAIRLAKSDNSPEVMRELIGLSLNLINSGTKRGHVLGLDDPTLEDDGSLLMRATFETDAALRNGPKVVEHYNTNAYNMPARHQGLIAQAENLARLTSLDRDK